MLRRHVQLYSWLNTSPPKVKVHTPEPRVPMILYRSLFVVRAGQCQTNTVRKHRYQSRVNKLTIATDSSYTTTPSVLCLVEPRSENNLNTHHCTTPDSFARLVQHQGHATRLRSFRRTAESIRASSHTMPKGSEPSGMSCEAFNRTRPARVGTLERPSRQGSKDRLQAMLSPVGEFSFPHSIEIPTQLGLARYSQSR